MNLNLKKIFSEGNVDRKVFLCIAVMSCLVVLIILMIINRNIEKNNNVKIDGLTELTTLYAKNIQIDTEKILVGGNYVSAYLADRYQNNILFEDNAERALKVLLNNNSFIHAGFVFVNNDTVVNEVDIDELINKKIEKEELIDNKDDEEKNESGEDKESIKKTTTRKNTSSNENISILIYRDGERYGKTTLDRIKASNNQVSNETDRKYKLNYVNTILTGQLQLMEPTVCEYGETTKRTITYSFPIIVDGFVKGVMGFDLDYEKTDANFISLVYSTDTSYTIINNDGKIVSAVNEDLIGKNYKDTFRSKEVKFLDELVASGNSDHYIQGNNAMVLVPIRVMGNQYLNLLGEFSLNDSYSTNIGVTVIISVSIVILFILFCISIWYIMSKMFSQRFDQIYKKFTENLSKEIMENLKANLTMINDKIDENEKNVENMINGVENTVENKSDEEIEAILEKAKESLLKDDDEKAQESSVETKVEGEETKQVQKSSLSDILNEPAVPPTPEEKVEEPQKVEEELKVTEEPKVVETPKTEASLGDILNEPVAPPIPEEKFEEPQKVEEELKVVEEPKTVETPKAEASLEKILNEPVVPPIPEEKFEEPQKVEEEIKENDNVPVSGSALDSFTSDSAKSDLDEILANKDGNITDDSFMKEAEAKLAAAVENKASDKVDEVKTEELPNETESLETIVPKEDINELVNKINADKDAEESTEKIEEKTVEEKKE